MTDVVKWGLLGVGIIALVALVVALPFVAYIDGSEYASALANVVSIAGDAFQFGRGLINCFLLPVGRQILSGLMIWLVGKWVLMTGIKIGAWAYHYILK